MTTKTDTYNYTQNPLGGTSYTTITPAGLQSTASGAHGSSSGVQDNVTSWATSNYTFLGDHTSEITFSTTTSNDWGGAAVRLKTTGGVATGAQGYIAYYIPETTSVQVYVLSAATANTIGGAGSYILQITATSFASSDKLKLGIVGTLLTVYKNGTSIGTVTDTTYSGGQPGLAYEFGNSNGTFITAWTGTDASSGSPTATIAWIK
jgi:hypothetical protein